jgi:hypothetical protein
MTGNSMLYYCLSMVHKKHAHIESLESACAKEHFYAYQSVSYIFQLTILRLRLFLKLQQTANRKWINIYRRTEISKKS